MAHGPVDGDRIFRVTLQFQLSQSRCSTRFHVRDAGVQDKGEQDVLDLVVPIADTQFRALLTQQDKLLGVDVVHLATKTGVQHSFGTTAGSIAVGVGNEVPSFNAVTLALKGELRTKYGHGRMFLPVHSDTFIESEQLAAGGVTAINSLITALTDEFVGSPLTHDFVMCNYHAAKGSYTSPTTGVTRPAMPESYYDVVSIRLNTQVTSLGSRKAGRGS